MNALFAAAVAAANAGTNKDDAMVQLMLRKEAVAQASKQCRVFNKWESRTSCFLPSRLPSSFPDSGHEA